MESSAPSGGPSTESLARVFLRPVASPLPLAFFAFGIGTLLAGMLEIGAIPVSESRDVGLILVLSILMAVAAARYVLLGLHEITAEPSLKTASGIVALVAAGLAAYGGLALLAEDATQRTVLPFFRAGVSRSSIEHGVQGQLDRVQREAGVRAQL